MLEKDLEMLVNSLNYLIIFNLSVCFYLGNAARSHADGPPQIVLVENTDLSGSETRLHYPVLISIDRGYRIRCESQNDEDDIIRGLGFLTAPSAVLDPLSEVLAEAEPLQNPLLCPNSAGYPIKVFRHNDEGGDNFYFQFPEAIGSTIYTNKIYIPGCKELADALKVDLTNVAEADPRPFFGNAIHKIECKAGQPIQSIPNTFAAWCAKADLTPEQSKTVAALLKATPDGPVGQGNAAACQQAETFLKSLPSVDLSAFELTDVEPVASLPNLTMLDLSNNKLAEIGALASLPNLRFLDLSDNEIANISSLGALSALTELDLGGNKVSNLRPLSSVITLQKLDLSRNEISDISPLSRLMALMELRLADNALTGASIEMITGLSALTFLDLSNNQVETLEHVGELPSNVAIRLDGNPVFAHQITTFADTCVLFRADATPFGFTIRALVESTGLTTCQDAANALSSNATLTLSGKGISDIRPLGLLGNLRSLDLSGNSIVDVSPLRRLVELRQLNLATNSIRDVTPIAQLVNLDTLDLSANPVEVATYLPACLMRNHEGGLTEDQLIEVQALFSASEKPTCLASKEHLERVTRLRVAGAQLRSLNYFAVLQRASDLELPDNQLTNVSALSALPNLTRLDLRQNQIGTLQSFAGLTRLSSLILSKNPINSLNNVQMLANLTMLDISDTGIRVIRALNTLPVLEQARLRNLSIEYLGFEDYCLVDKFDSLALGVPRAFVLSVSAVASAQNVDTRNCQAYGDWASNLRILNLNKRDLANIDPVRHFGSLKELYLYDNRIQDMSPIVNLGNLETVSLATNLITNVPRLQSRNLKSLNLNENRIVNVSSLSDLQSLEGIYLQANLIEDATPLRDLNRINSLDLRGNRISFMRGLAHWSLPATYISGNPICAFPHESPVVMQACQRRPRLIIDRLDDIIVISPHIIVGRRFDDLIVQPNQ